MNHKGQKDALRWRLRLIFLYYASYADRNNYKLLKTQNYRRFLIDSEAVTSQAGFPPFDIAFRKVHTSSIKLEQFQELLPVIAQIVSPNKKRTQAFQLFISRNMEKLYHQILEHSEFGTDVLSIERLLIDSRSLQMLSSPAIHRAYQHYIQSTSMHQKEPEHTFEQVHSFLSDFEVSPKLVYKAMVYLVFFQQLMISQGNSWGIEDFQKLLICLAQLHWRRTEEAPSNQETKILRLLQHMETSVGFKKMVDKNLKENAVLISFFKFPLRLATELRESRQRELASSRQKTESQVGRSLEDSRYQSVKRERQIDFTTLKELQAEKGDLANKLRQIFERLCSYGEVGNIHTLKSIKIKKYFRNLNIFSQIEQTWLDITISDLCRGSPSGKVEFPQFLQLLQLCAQKLNIGWQGLFHYISDHGLSELSNSRILVSPKNITKTKVQPQTFYILLHIEKTLEKIFVHYKGSKKGLTFQQLSHFLFDFEVFPTFVSKSKLYSYFQNRSIATNELKKLAGDISLDMNGLLEVIADVSSQIGENLQPEERVLFVLERMQDSQGHRTLLGSQGTNLIGDLRSRYASIYKQNLKKNSPIKDEGFEDLLEAYSR